MSMAFSNYVKSLEKRIDTLEAEAKGGILELTKLIVDICDKLTEFETKQAELMTTIAATRVIASQEGRRPGRPRKLPDGQRPPDRSD